MTTDEFFRLPDDQQAAVLAARPAAPERGRRKAEFERIRAVAERLDYSAETIRLWCLKGYFPGATRSPVPGSEWRIPKGAKPDFTAGKSKTTRRTVRRATR